MTEHVTRWGHWIGKFRKKIGYGHEIDFRILPGSRRGQKSNVHNHILRGKNPEQKILIFHDEN